MARACLVVDDSRVVRRVARGILETQGFAVEEAENGAMALAACRCRTPDLVLLDANMPVMAGLEFLRILRAEFGPEHPAVVLCTSESEIAFIAEALAAGAQEYIMKPFDADILLGKLAQIGMA
jgi:two-component system chemotaxis response regulator CheY